MIIVIQNREPPHTRQCCLAIYPAIRQTDLYANKSQSSLEPRLHFRVLIFILLNPLKIWMPLHSQSFLFFFFSSSSTADCRSPNPFRPLDLIKFPTLTQLALLSLLNRSIKPGQRQLTHPVLISLSQRERETELWRTFMHFVCPELSILIFLTWGFLFDHQILFMAN